MKWEELFRKMINGKCRRFFLEVPRMLVKLWSTLDRLQVCHTAIQNPMYDQKEGNLRGLEEEGTARASEFKLPNFCIKHKCAHRFCANVLQFWLLFYVIFGRFSFFSGVFLLLKENFIWLSFPFSPEIRWILKFIYYHWVAFFKLRLLFIASKYLSNAINALMHGYLMLPTQVDWLAYGSLDVSWTQSWVLGFLGTWPVDQKARILFRLSGLGCFHTS